MSEKPTWPPGARFDVDPAESYYVIVGMGVSALTDHLTLRATLFGKARLAGRRILHVGNIDPWQQYAPLEMGQWAALLTLPGFRHRASGRSDYGFLPSRDFSEVSRRQWHDLANENSFFALPGKVTEMKKTDAGIVLTVLRPSGTTQTITSHNVDVCAGPGPARRENSIVPDATLRQEYETAVSTVRQWPRLVTGDAFLMNSTQLPANGGTIAVIGGGPTAAWCVERAEANGCPVWWVARESLHPAFLSSGRNDRLAQGPLRRSRVNGIYAVDADCLLYPRGVGTTFVEGLEVVSIAPTSNQNVNVTFRANSDARFRFGDAERIEHSLPTAHEFHQVVLAIGLLQHSQPGSWPHILEEFLKESKGRYLLKDRLDRVIGLELADGAVRVLGAAALSFPEVSREWRQKGTPSYDYFQSLVEQCRDPAGAMLSTSLIAEANGYWPADGSNKNVNMNGLNDLSVLWPSALPEAAQKFIEMRACRIAPFTWSELKTLWRRTADRY